MDYLQLILKMDTELLEDFVNELYVKGIENLAIEDPRDVQELMEKKGSYEWDYVSDSLTEDKDKAKVIVYMPKDDTADGDIVRNILRCEKFQPIEMLTEELAEKDWKDKWKEFFKPFKITDRITVKPSWESYEKSSDSELVINIDPGMAFGTGTHETTGLCIELLEKYYKDGNSILDVGTGSGILAIAARLLGAGDIIAVDIDPVAVTVAKENLLTNGINDVSVIQGDLTKDLDLSVDIVLANLMADLVVMLSADVLKCLNVQGIFISSGILLEKRDMVLGELEKNGFSILEILEKGEWCAIAAKKRDE